MLIEYWIILITVCSFISLILINSYKQTPKTMTKLNIKKIIETYGDGYYFSVDTNGKILNCFSIATVENKKNPIIMQTIGNEKVYGLSDIEHFLNYGHLFVHISVIYRCAKFNTPRHKP